MNEVIEFFQKLFEAENWPPRWHCGKWTSFHGWLYIISDLAIWAAYFLIPVFLIRLINKRPGIPFPAVFWLFGAFILFCGLTHLIDAAMFWWPAYRLNGLMRFATAIVSWATIYALFKIFPSALALKTSQEFNAELTERKKVEEQLLVYTQELELKNKEMEQFAYVASHDLQEPLRTIANYIELLNEHYAEKKDENTQRYFNYINSATVKMQLLIKDLLEFSRVGADISMGTIDSAKVVNEVMTDLDITIKESQAQIKAISMPVVYGNETELKRLFQNLISNAIKFRKPNTNPEIVISAEDKEKEFIFSVKDNGIGIEEKFFSKLFAIFQRLHSSAEYPGTGIGLATCHKIVMLHKGKIWVESKPGTGTTFYFTLPKAA
jgi:two-component system, chemotaxis family, sensor kinase Cph1